MLALLHEDRISELLSLIAPPDVGMLAMDNPDLRDTLVVALSAVQWQAFDQAVFFYGLLASGGRDGEQFTLFEELSGLRDSWLDVCRRAPCPAPLDRVIRLARLVPEDLRGRLLGELHEDVERDPDAYRRFFSGFTFDDDGALIEHVRVCLTVEGFPERIAIDAREQSVRSAAALELRRVEAVARRRRRRMLLSHVVGPIAFFVLGAVISGEYELLGGVFLVLTANFWMLMLGGYKGGYRKGASPKLFALARP